jgi:uncharacterized membrane protein
VIWAAILVASAGCYLLKLGGLSLPAKVLQAPRLQRIAALTPVSLLSALIAVQAFTSGQRIVFDARVLGLAVAAFAVWRRWPFLLVVVVAAGSTALLRLLLR